MERTIGTVKRLAMEKTAIIIYSFAAIFFAITVIPAYAAHEYEGWRCGNLIVEKGVEAFLVLKHCGEPNYKENIGHREGQHSGAKREKWVYGPDAGYYYVLHVVSGVVDKVEAVRNKN